MSAHIKKVEIDELNIKETQESELDILTKILYELNKIILINWKRVKWFKCNITSASSILAK